MKEKKFIEIVPTNKYEIMTDDGWQPILSSNKTIKYEEWIIKTTNHTIKCADTHIIFDKYYNEIFTKDLNIGDEIITNDGLESITEVYPTNKFSNMYDIAVNSTDHRYYADGILSHNTTAYSIFACWLICFNTDKRVLILANKGSIAIEIMGHLRMAFELLPKWLKPGVVTWNKRTIEFTNGCKIQAFATASDAARGTSSNCVTADSDIILEAQDGMLYKCPISHIENIPNITDFS